MSGEKELTLPEWQGDQTRLIIVNPDGSVFDEQLTSIEAARLIDEAIATKVRLGDAVLKRVTIDLTERK